jgi:hypothetical protein
MLATMQLAVRAAQSCNCQTRVPQRFARVSDSTTMDTHLKLKRLDYADLIKLGRLAAEAMELSQEYDRARAHSFCNLAAACNVEMLARRAKARRQCGTAL